MKRHATHPWLAGVTGALAALLALPFSSAQTEVPPERDNTSASSQLPKLDAPPPKSIGKLAVTFIGASAFNEKKLREGIARQIRTIEESRLDAANAYDAAFFLESFYRKNGYSQVTAKGEIVGPWSLRLIVAEGPLNTVGSVTILGNKSHTVDDLTKYLLGPTRERFPRIKKTTDLPFVEADVQAGAGLVTRLFAAEGFPLAVIEPPEFRFEADAVDITLRVTEGPQYWFGPITFVGAPYPRTDLLPLLDFETGKPFTPGRLETMRQKVEDFLKKRGHFTAKVEARADREKAPGVIVPAAFVITAGPRFRFDGVTLQGLRDVRPRFVENRFATLHGQIYDPDKIDEKFREMIQTGLFRNLRIHPKVAEDNQIRLDIEIEEAKPKEFGIGIGYGSYEGAIANLSYTDRNFFHSGRPLTFRVEYTSRGYKGEVLWSDPWFFESDFRFRARLYAQTREVDGYSKFELGLQPTLTRNITKQWEISAFVLAKRVTIQDASIFPATLVGPDEYLANSIGISTTLDFRNNPANPTRGFIGTATFDAASAALGSEVEFLRGTARFSYYLPVTKRSDLAFGARAGIISPLGKSSRRPTASVPAGLPIDERFFSGGSTTVRSFAERELGPKDLNGVPIGGEAFTVFNIEYTFPVYGDVKGAVFADAGNLRARAGDFSLSDMRYGVGAGLRYNLPFGPIRLDYAVNPSRRPGEDVGAFHFSIGVAF